MNFHFIIVLVIFITSFVYDAISTDEVVTSAKKTHISGTGTAKVAIEIPTTSDRYDLDKEFSKKLLNNILSNVNKSPKSAIERSPFMYMSKWRKLSMLSFQQYILSWKQEGEESFAIITKALGFLFGAVHDYALIIACDNYDDQVLEERELIIIRKVKKYLRTVSESYLGVPLMVDALVYKLEEADYFDDVIYPKKVKRMSLLKKDQHGKVIIVCYLNPNAIKSKYTLSPNEAFSRYEKVLGYNNEPKNYHVTGTTQVWLCKDYFEDKLKRPFVLINSERTYIRSDGAKFFIFWPQTYVDNVRMQILDMIRLKLIIYRTEEPFNYKLIKNAINAEFSSDSSPSSETDWFDV